MITNSVAVRVLVLAGGDEATLKVLKTVVDARKGDRTVFVTTRGFADSLRIAYQHRPKLFVRRIARTPYRDMGR